MTRILLTGATGFVGRRLAGELVAAGHEVVAMTRRPEDYRGAGEPVGGDVADLDSLIRAAEGCEVAYYLVHSLDDEDFERKDAELARTFAQAMAEAGVGRIIYLGGLGGEGALSAHLRSRRQVERILAETGVPVTVLRAAIVVGKGGISWEITRQLVKNLPAMVVPKWASTRTQPIALDDVIDYLVGVLAVPQTAGETYEIGGPDVLDYAQMLQQAALVMSGREVLMVSVPVLSPRLSSAWLALVTDVDLTTGRNLIDSMSTEVIVRDDRIRELIEVESVPYLEAVRRALEAPETSAAEG